MGRQSKLPSPLRSEPRSLKIRRVNFFNKCGEHTLLKNKDQGVNLQKSNRGVEPHLKNQRTNPL